jgi:hypothetical protein
MFLLKNLLFHYVYVQYLEVRLIYYIAQSLLEMGQTTDFDSLLLEGRTSTGGVFYIT